RRRARVVRHVPRALPGDRRRPPALLRGAAPSDGVEPRALVRALRAPHVRRGVALVSPRGTAVSAAQGSLLRAALIGAPRAAPRTRSSAFACSSLPCSSFPPSPPPA